MRGFASINFRHFKSTITAVSGEFSVFITMYRKCCMPKCNSLRQNVKLHQFPAREENRNRWLQCIGVNVCEATTNMFVCHKHFEQRFVNLATNRLKCGAYPTLFTDLEISSGIPSIVTKDIVNKDTNNDHTYAKKRHYEHTYAGPSKATKVAFSISTVTPTLACTEPATASCSTATHDTEVSYPSCGTPKKLPKRRLIRSVITLSPRCRQFYEQYKKAQRQNNYKSRAKKALAFSKAKSLEEMTKNMNPIAKKVLLMQVNMCTKSKKVRRFTKEEKLIALSIYKQGPKSYKFLQKIFILPSKTTLKKLITQLNIDTGINPKIFEHIQQQVINWESRKKICTIIYDEMAIESALTYVAHKDNIVGFVEVDNRINQFADHALVFMLRGAVFKWQQPIAFYFCEGATSSLQLKNILRKIISAVADTGLIPIALVSDQGSSFQSAVKGLLEESKQEQLRTGLIFDEMIHLNGHCLNVIFDPPHLLKGIRNNLLTKDMMFEGRRVTWSDIVDVYNADCNHGETRILHRLTDQHVILDKIKKMKVKNCVRVLSKSVSAALSYTAAFPTYPDGTPVSKTMANTSEAISFFDDLFDSVNGASTTEKGKYLRCAVTKKSAHHAFWDKAINILQGVKYI